MEMEERLKQLREQIEETAKTVESVEKQGAFVQMKVAQLENKQKSDLLFFQDQFALKLQKIKEKPLSQQDQFQLMSFFKESQSSWDKKINNLGTILHKKVKYAQKKDNDNMSQLSRTLQEHIRHFQNLFQNTHNTFTQQLNQVKSQLQQKLEKEADGGMKVYKDKLEFLQRTIEGDFIEQRKKIETVEGLMKRGEKIPMTGMEGQEEQLKELRERMNGLGQDIKGQLADSGENQKRVNEGIQEETKEIRQIEKNREEIEKRVQDIQRQVITINSRLTQSQARREQILINRVINPLNTLSSQYHYITQ